MKTYEHTRALLAAAPNIQADYVVVGCIIAQHIDWKTNEKHFASTPHYQNWMKSLSSQYGYDGPSLHNALKGLAAAGFFKVDKDGYAVTISLSMPEEDYLDKWNAYWDEQVAS